MAGRRLRAPSYQPYELDLRQQFLRAVLAGGAGIAVAYLLLGVAAAAALRLFPWDAIAGLLWLLVAAAFFRRGTPRSMAWAASWLVAGATILAVLYTQLYGVRHPITALFLICIILAGLLIGGWFLPLWTVLVSLFVLLWSVNEARGLHAAVPAPLEPGAFWPVVLLWWFLFAMAGALVWLFAHYLERAVRVSRAQTAALTGTLRALAAQPELDTFLKQILATVTHLFQAPWASLFLYSAEEQQLSLRRAVVNEDVRPQRGLASAQTPPALHLPLDLWQEVAAARTPLAIQDIEREPRIVEKAPFRQEGVRSLLLVPLLREQEAIGYLSISSLQRHAFRRQEIRLAQAMAQQAALGLQLSAVGEQAREAAVLEERNRIAREIHDTLAQDLTALVIQVDAARELLPQQADGVGRHLDRAAALAQTSLEEARRSLWALHPEALDRADLGSALRHLAGELAAEWGTAVAVRVSGAPYRLPAAAEGELMRISQEAITNALRHAAARRVDVGLHYEPDKLALVVRDDGQGFDPHGQPGFGLRSMRERAARINAVLTIDPDVRPGTMIVCTVPRADPSTPLTSF